MMKVWYDGCQVRIHGDNVISTNLDCWVGRHGWDYEGATAADMMGKSCCCGALELDDFLQPRAKGDDDEKEMSKERS